jgi:hypothetical protein
MRASVEHERPARETSGCEFTAITGFGLERIAVRVGQLADLPSDRLLGR